MFYEFQFVLNRLRAIYFVLALRSSRWYSRRWVCMLTLFKFRFLYHAFAVGLRLDAVINSLLQMLAQWDLVWWRCWRFFVSANHVLVGSNNYCCPPCCKWSYNLVVRVIYVCACLCVCVCVSAPELRSHMPLVKKMLTWWGRVDLTCRWRDRPQWERGTNTKMTQHKIYLKKKSKQYI
jgi:hypothetical protein